MATLKKMSGFDYNKIYSECSPSSEEVESLSGTINRETIRRRPEPKHGHFTAVCSLLVILVLLGLSIAGVAAIAMSSWSELSNLRQQNENITLLLNSRGVVYTRWGSISCLSNNTVTLYSGLMGGTRSSDIDGGSTFLCLPSDPEYVSDSRTNTLSGSFSFSLVSALRYKSPSTDVVSCAICSVLSHAQVITIPARTSCPEGWTMEYYGYIMSASSHRTEFVCVDHNQDTVPGEHDVMMAATALYYVKAHCGSLPCPPYDQERRLSCVVCTK